jgi:hypothetical protein
MSNFIEDLKFGEHWENVFLQHIDFDRYVKKGGKYSDYDLKVYYDGNTTRYEVKADRRTFITNNIAIEFECFNKPSGINKTRANKYVYFEIEPGGYVMYIIPVKYINKCIMENKFKREVKGGDFNKSKMYLFDKSIFSRFIHCRV